MLVAAVHGVVQIWSSRVDRNTFTTRLLVASTQALDFARQSVLQALSDDVAFLVFPNRSYDGNPLVGDEIVFPGDSLLGKYHGPWSADEVVAFLWRNEKVPEWIDCFVQAQDNNRTLVHLTCCGRFTAQECLLYHMEGGIPPFQAMGPRMPPEYFIGQKEGKFDLNWQEQRWSGKTIW
jgi:hypothetical protein